MICAPQNAMVYHGYQAFPVLAFSIIFPMKSATKWGFPEVLKSNLDQTSQD